MKTKTPTRTRIGRAISAVLVSAALGLPASAAAEIHLPHPKDPTINVPGSIGEVGLGGTIEDATKAWGGSPQKDCSPSGCFYGHYPKTGTAYIAVGPETNALEPDARVTLVTIQASSESIDRRKLLIEPALGKFKTKEGIGLGSKVSKVKEAYPKAKTGPGYLDVKGNDVMTFGFDRFNGHYLITSVVVSG